MKAVIKTALASEAGNRVRRSTRVVYQKDVKDLDGALEVFKAYARRLAVPYMADSECGIVRWLPHKWPYAAPQKWVEAYLDIEP